METMGLKICALVISCCVRVAGTLCIVFEKAYRIAGLSSSSSSCLKGELYQTSGGDGGV
jgi:hypothetical protein